jgi:N-succinyl-L-ornithine transcarbamylase
MEVISLNVGSDSWQLEYESNVVMDGSKAEHLKEAVPVMSGFCDIIGVRSFPLLKDREQDYADQVLQGFLRYSSIPVISLESAILHPLQSLADLMTIEEFKTRERPRVVMTWAPHIKALPQAVPNSFAQWMTHSQVDFTITHPPGMELDPAFTGNATIEHDQEKALEAADFVYVKNWSSYQDYGKSLEAPEWKITLEKLKKTNHARLMHCLPVRRNVVIDDQAMDSEHSIIIQQAHNRLYSAQAVLKEILIQLQ